MERTDDSHEFLRAQLMQWQILGDHPARIEMLAAQLEVVFCIEISGTKDGMRGVTGYQVIRT
jgi:hypothetical protein